jgi:hypothetical protein
MNKRHSCVALCSDAERQQRQRTDQLGWLTSITDGHRRVCFANAPSMVRLHSFGDSSDPSDASAVARHFSRFTLKAVVSAPDGPRATVIELAILPRCRAAAGPTGKSVHSQRNTFWRVNEHYFRNNSSRDPSRLSPAGRPVGTAHPTRTGRALPEHTPPHQATWRGAGKLTLSPCTL